MLDPQGWVSRQEASAARAAAFTSAAQGRGQGPGPRKPAGGQAQRPGRAYYVWMKRWKLVRVNS